MFPKLTLILENNLQTLIFEPEKGLSRELARSEDDFYELINSIAQELEITPEENTLDSLLKAALEGDEKFIDEIPEIDFENNTFDIEEIIKTQLEKALAKTPEHEYGVEVPQEVLDELKSNDNLDIFASLLEILYYLLIIKSLAYAKYLGVDKIHLEDSAGLYRLHERLTSEAGKLGYEVVIEK